MRRRLGEENNYQYEGTFEDGVLEEDRALENDLTRAQIDYYAVQYDISKLFLDTLQRMSFEERKEVLKGNSPIKRIIKE